MSARGTTTTRPARRCLASGSVAAVVLAVLIAAGLAATPGASPAAAAAAAAPRAAAAPAVAVPFPDSTCQPGFCVTTSAAMLAWTPDAVPLSQRADTAWNPSLAIELTGPRLTGATDILGASITQGTNDYADAFQGSGDSGNVYNFRYWQYTGVFYYYSHSALAVPPTGWINAAHRNGVPILGILTGDCDKCDEENNLFYDNPNAATQLIAMARTYGFDGWLFDIERGVDPVRARPVMSAVRATTGPTGRPLISLYYEARITDLAYKPAQDSFNAAGYFQSDYGPGNPEASVDVRHAQRAAEQQPVPHGLCGVPL